MPVQTDLFRYRTSESRQSEGLSWGSVPNRGHRRGGSERVTDVQEGVSWTELRGTRDELNWLPSQRRTSAHAREIGDSGADV